MLSLEKYQLVDGESREMKLSRCTQKKGDFEALMVTPKSPDILFDFRM